MLALCASTAQGQAQRKATSTVGTTSTTTTVVHDDGSSVTVSSPGHANTTDVSIKTTNERQTYPVNNGGIIVDDHAYQPAGTATVGFFGNGMGGSTIGSSPASGGTGVGATTTGTEGTKRDTKAKTNTSTK